MCSLQSLWLKVSQRNAQFFEAETDKLDGWADDLKLGLERETKEMDRQIKKARRAATVAITLEEKLAGQKQIKALEAQRDAKRRSPPVFEEITGAAVVTFRVNVAGAAQRTAQVTEQVTGQVAGQVTGQVGAKSQLESELESGPSRREVGTKSGLSRDQVKILRLCRKEGTLLEIMNSVGRKNRTKFRAQFISRF